MAHLAACLALNPQPSTLNPQPSTLTTDLTADESLDMLRALWPPAGPVPPGCAAGSAVLHRLSCRRRFSFSLVFNCSEACSDATCCLSAQISAVSCVLRRSSSNASLPLLAEAFSVDVRAPGAAADALSMRLFFPAGSLLSPS